MPHLLKPLPGSGINQDQVEEECERAFFKCFYLDGLSYSVSLYVLYSSPHLGARYCRVALVPITCPPSCQDGDVRTAAIHDICFIFFGWSITSKCSKVSTEEMATHSPGDPGEGLKMIVE